MDRNHPKYDQCFSVRPLLENIRQSCLQETPGERQCRGASGLTSPPIQSLAGSMERIVSS
ncbi:hypothetical protein T12_10622 [Trichinella patagoniensis]|uniref:Uncharacterized protein n=1 Tax=Trichinella patagoniensis TaxID=990121 RepID=A0A0V1ACM5_9BILA|nr:hypothetical protein T12_10622 [Trichinella patagoniensis]